MDADEMLSTKQVAQDYGFFESTLRYYRHRGTGPASFRLGAKRVVYRRSAVEAWISMQEAASTRGGITP